jgi:hypothetical protein
MVEYSEWVSGVSRKWMVKFPAIPCRRRQGVLQAVCADRGYNFFHFNFVRLKVSFVTLRFLGELLSGNRFSWCNPGYVLQRLAGLKTHFPAGTSTGTTGSSLQFTRDTTVHRP